MEEDDAIPHLPRGRSRSGLWLSLVVLLAIGAGVYAARDRIAALVGAGGSPEDPAAPFVASGDRSLRRDHPDAYEEAITQYTKALAFREHHPRALAGLSRAHALIAQEQIFEAQVLEARASDDPALRGEAASLRRQAREHAERALECAETAVRHASSDAEVEVALGDALRISGDRTHARSRLDRVRTMEGAPSAEALRVEALLVADEAGSLAAARPIAERAVAEDPSLLRARLLLARAQLAAGDTASARAQLQAVLDRAPDHPTARALLEQLGAGAVALPTAPAPGGSLIPRSLPSATATGPGISTSTAPVAPSQTGSGTAMSTSTGTPSTANVPAHDVRGGPGGATAERGGETDLRGRDYEALIREAETRLENGDTRRARALYEQALRERPGGVEAMTGIGFVLLAEGEVRGAVSQFQSAAERGYADAYIGLGDAYRRLGDRERALQAYEAYLERHSAGPKASIARRQAERLRAELARTESAFGGGAGGGPSGGSGQAGTPGSDTPVTRPEELPAPRGSTTPPPRDVPGDIPSIESEP
jgi:tetratricopeptide (TPR) repeat protein